MAAIQLTIEQVVSRYLFNSDTLPANLEDECLICPAHLLHDDARAINERSRRKQ